MDQDTRARPGRRRRILTVVIVGAILAGGIYFPLSTLELISRQIMVNKWAPRKNPWPAYWFWTGDTLEDDAWRKQARDLAARAPFDLVFATPRYPHTGVDFLDVERFLPRFTAAQRILWHADIGLGLDLRFYLGARGEVPPDERQQVVERIDLTVGADGRGAAPLPPTPALFPAIAAERAAEVVRVYATGGDGLRRVATRASAVVDGEVRITVDPGSAGRALSALVARSFNHPDLFSEAYPRAIRATLTAYRELGPAGVALDEFAFMPLREDRWRTALFYSAASAAAFRVCHGADLLDAIATMLLGGGGPAGVRDALRYHRHHRRAIAAIETLFHDLVARSRDGPTFVGVHPTNQTRSNYAELERALTFLDWWSVPRACGQTDEETPLAVRMALALQAGGSVWYNMYYHHDPEKILDEVARCARFGGRVHFHAWGDAHHGYPLEKGDLLARLTAMKRRLGVLDRHVKGVPELDTLVVLGWPAIMLDPGPAYGDAMRFLNALWERGYRAAAVPTYAIAGGDLGLEAGLARYGGRVFRNVIVYRPEYATPATRAWLAGLEHAEVGFIGRLTRGSDGEELSHDEAIGGPRHRGETMTEEEALAEAGPAFGTVGVRYPGNRWVVLDRQSLVDGSTARRTLTIGGKPFELEFSGAAVVEAAPGKLPRVLR